MAVTSTAAVVALRRPRVTDFIRLKLRITVNTLRGNTWRMVLYLFGAAVGLGLALLGFSGFAAGAAAWTAAAGSAGPAGRETLLLVLPAFLGTGLVLSWLFLPLLFFGVDETLDPARFALLPLPRRTLAVGMLAAACVGVPAAATLVASSGLIVVGAVGAGPVGATVGALGALLGLLVCVIASRAVTSAFAGALRSRRTRDLAAVVIAVLASSVAPLQLLVSSALSSGWDQAQLVRVARVLSWTPVAAPFTAVADATSGRWGVAAAHLAIGAGTIGLLLWWWSRTLETAMLGTVSGSAGGATRRGAGNRAGRSAPAAGPGVLQLFPLLLRWLPRNRFGAIVARESRYWWRDPRRRAGLISLTIAGIVVPGMLRLYTQGPDHVGAPLPLAVAFAGMLAGTVLANQFGNDGTGYAAHLLAGVPGRLELRARVAALAVTAVPVLVSVTLALALFSHGAAELPAALGVTLGGFTVSAAVAGVVSVLAPYALPDTTNPFAMSGGSAGAKGLLALVGMFTSAALIAPVLVAALLLDRPWDALALPGGLCWGIALLLLTTHLAGRLLDRRGPEVLVAITPRR